MIINTLYQLIPCSLKDHPLAYSYAKNIISCILVACIATPTYAILYYYLNYHLAAIVILLTGTLIISAGLLLQTKHSIFWSRQLIVAPLFFCIVWLSYSLGGLTAPPSSWLVLPPLIAIFLGGRKDSIFWGSCSVSVIILFFFLKYLQLSSVPIIIPHLLLLEGASLGGLIIIILWLESLFEKGRRVAIKEIQKANQELRRAKDKTEAFAKKAQSASLLKSEFVANMSHELRTPLNGIIGFTDLMYSGKAGSISPEQREYLNDISTSAHHLLQLINDILDLSKIESGKMSFHPEPVNLTNVILEVKNNLLVLLENKDLVFTLEVEPAVNQVVIDRQKFIQIIYNYLSNAIKFTTDGGTIKVSVRALGSENFKFSVEDNGIGIEVTDIPKLFNPFRQLDPGYSKKYPGTGLGLALTRRMVEAQGGKVGVKSELGKGSTFFTILPRYPAEY